MSKRDNSMPVARSRQRDLRVVVADDFALHRNRVVELLEHQGIQVVGQTVTGEAAVLLAEALRPDVVIMDARMPGGISATRQLYHSVPGCRVVGFSMAADRDAEARMRAAGAAAYVHAFDPPQVLLDAVLPIEPRVSRPVDDAATARRATRNRTARS